MKRGEIYYIKSSYSESGFEIKGSRPGVIVSNDKNNERSGCLEVVFMTTQPKKNLPTHVLVREDTARPSTVLCEQITTVDVGRFADYMGTLTDEEMREVDKALAISLGLDHETIKTETAVTVKAEEDDDFDDGMPYYEELLDERIKLAAERDVYKELCTELLSRLTR
jgi:mRNA interferase MazF